VSGSAWIAVAYGAMSLVAFAVFAADKSAAGRGAPRIPERMLHLLELLGGWPGTVVGAVLLRHKTRKPSYLVVLGLVAALHGAAWAWHLGLLS
jgi:uncharacterized membrane protein YsdA (DUF1294 family)